MKVKVIESSPNGPLVLAEGDWDGRVVDDMFGRVNGELYAIAFMFAEDKADFVINELRALVEERKKLARRIFLLYHNNNVVART